AQLHHRDRPRPRHALRHGPQSDLHAGRQLQRSRQLHVPRVNDGQVNGNTATVSITVLAVNDAPVANAQSVTVTYNTPKAITLTGSDLEGIALTYSIVDGPTNGA